MKFWKQYCPHILATIILGFMIWSGINPVDRFTWWAEILPAMLMFILLIATFKQFRFSNTAYFLASIGFSMHIIGSHYTFAEVPFEWFSELFCFERNHYDRLGHFSAGLWAYPIAELVQRSKFITNQFAIYLFSLLSIISFAALYELFEWGYAVILGGKQASDFLGSQGDIWDAQKDILADTLGAFFILWFYPWRREV